jgi:predicted metal-dependent phosphoesterase TrpH
MMQVRFSKPDIPALRKERMLVDMHFHSKYSRDCSTPVESIIRRCNELGVSVVLTDHNSIGGVIAAERIAPGVIKPGVEICTKEGKDVIPYFYSAEELVAFFDRVVQPKLKRNTSLQSNATLLPIADLLDELKRERCVIALPHPFALPPRRSYMFFNRKAHRHLLDEIDAFEVINQTMVHKQNLASIGWATQFDKAAVGGSDGHNIRALGSAFTVAKARSWEEFLDAVRKREAQVIGEERSFRHQVLNARDLIREKARFIRNLDPSRK